MRGSLSSIVDIAACAIHFGLPGRHRARLGREQRKDSSARHSLRKREPDARPSFPASPASLEISSGLDRHALRILRPRRCLGQLGTRQITASWEVDHRPPSLPGPRDSCRQPVQRDPDRRGGLERVRRCCACRDSDGRRAWTWGSPARSWEYSGTTAHPLSSNFRLQTTVFYGLWPGDEPRTPDLSDGGDYRGDRTYRAEI
jgi:hypothetical protein